MSGHTEHPTFAHIDSEQPVFVFTDGELGHIRRLISREADSCGPESRDAVESLAQRIEQIAEYGRVWEATCLAVRPDA